MNAASRKCSVEGCSMAVGLHGAKGMCAVHYTRARRESRPMTPTGICKCGCGADTFNGSMFLHGHWAKSSAGRNAISGFRYTGARSNHGDGYLSVRHDGKNKLEHVRLAEKAIGRELPKGAEVHHVNGIRNDNCPGNLVICQDASYHRLLHRRQRALDACGNASFRQCGFCRKWDSPENLYIPPSDGRVEHRACGNEYRKEMKRRKYERASQI